MAGTVSVSLTSGRALDALWVVAAASLFYTGGMLLNDAFDAPFDRTSRPERPIPNGDVSRGEAFGAGAGLLAAGLALLAGHGAAVGLGLVLAAAIVFYDARHKGHAFAPIVMGACRGLVYLIAAAAAGGVTRAAMAGAAVMTAYVASLTVVAKRAGADARWLVPLLIAGISLLDALFVLVMAPALWRLAIVAALGFPLTLALQRWVPGD
jgi:4-hydroxybenzoate polyprenyltransferase